MIDKSTQNELMLTNQVEALELFPINTYMITDTTANFLSLYNFVCSF